MLHNISKTIKQIKIHYNFVICASAALFYKNKQDYLIKFSFFLLEYAITKLCKKIQIWHTLGLSLVLA